MTAETIDHSTLSRLVEAGAVHGAHVVGKTGGWSVVIRFGKAERPLAAQRSRQVRVFKRMETLVSYLKDVGISRFDVDAADYVSETASRPDRAAALRRTHEAAEYDKWFREQVEEAIQEADGPNAVWISARDAEERMDKLRAELLAQLEPGEKAS
ncbi:hypothetical protein [Rhizobium leguminosarum]|uniref:hypothetical protein n=1 Tax=Rhizobium leguminosarum TaxID=384 RepID=UPI0013DB070A|nr:hypothetical protein [Rhizobium leguminosarum]NEK34764.1 hypothetical protein [Rhizobium leguminosarum]